MITVAEYIASENLGGVQELAQKLGYPVPKSNKEGYLFLKSLHVKDSETAKKYFSEIHPDKELLGTTSYNNMVVQPLNNNEMYNNAMRYNNAMNCASCGMINATGCSACSVGFKNVSDEVINKLENATDKGLLETERALNQGMDKVKEMLEKKDDRIFKYGMLLLAGIVIGKYILK